METKILFSEKQRFTQWWVWLILLGVLATPFYGLYHELQKAQPFSDPSVNTGLILSLAVILPVTALFIFMRLETQISKAGFAVKFFPFHFKFRQFAWSDLEEIYVREYSPVSDFGGWGLRYSLSGAGKAYNVSGHQGIQLVFKNGKKLLIGTNKPEEAAAALKQARPVDVAAN